MAKTDNDNSTKKPEHTWHCYCVPDGVSKDDDNGKNVFRQKTKFRY